jgi:RimJ/RimL family protein N-acetyltransferase
MDLPLPIETERLRLRPFALGDLAAYHRVRAREDIHRWLYSEPATEAEARQAIEQRIARPPETGVALVAELTATAEFVGDVTLTLGPPEHRQAEIGFAFDPAHQGRGYATEAAAAVVALAFGAYDLHRVYGRLEARNLASARVLEKLGMRREAHLVENEWVKGEWQSELVYALLAREWLTTAPVERGRG